MKILISLWLFMVSIWAADPRVNGVSVSPRSDFNSATNDLANLDGFSVLAYGGDNTGSTDSLTAINSAIAAANSSASKRSVYFPPGTYKVTSSVDFSGTSNMVIAASGATIHGTFGNAAIIAVSGATPGLVIRGLTVTGKGTGTVDRGFNMTSGAGLTLDHCTFTQCNEYGAVFGSVDSATILQNPITVTGCTFIDNAANVFNSSAEYVRFAHCQSSLAGVNYGVGYDRTALAGFGHGFFGAFGNVSIMNCDITGNFYGIGLDASQGGNPDHNIIANNTINHNEGYGLAMFLVGSGEIVQGNTMLSTVGPRGWESYTWQSGTDGIISAASGATASFASATATFTGMISGGMRRAIYIGTNYFEITAIADATHCTITSYGPGKINPVNGSSITWKINHSVSLVEYHSAKVVVSGNIIDGGSVNEIRVDGNTDGSFSHNVIYPNVTMNEVSICTNMSYAHNKMWSGASLSTQGSSVKGSWIDNGAGSGIQNDGPVHLQNSGADTYYFRADGYALGPVFAGSTAMQLYSGALGTGDLRWNAVPTEIEHGKDVVFKWSSHSDVGLGGFDVGLGRASVPGLLGITDGAVGLGSLLAHYLVIDGVTNTSLTASLPVKTDATKKLVSGAIDLSGSDATGTLAAARMPALTGDIVSSAGTVATTLANTAVSAGSYGDSTHAATFTVDAKGRLTAAGTAAVTNTITFALSDMTTSLATGTNLNYWIPKSGCTIKYVRANVSTVSSSGNPTFDILNNGTSVLSTLITIDASERSSDTAATPSVISSASVSAGDYVNFSITGAGTGATGAQLEIGYTVP